MDGDALPTGRLGTLSITKSRGNVKHGRRWIHRLTPIFTDFVLRGRGDFGAVVKRTQMDADEEGWTQINPPIDTDYRRFVCGGKACLALSPFARWEKGDKGG